MFLAEHCLAQHEFKLNHVKTHLFDRKVINERWPHAAFGGISAIEKLPEKAVKMLCNDCNSKEGSYFLFSDKRIAEKHNIFSMQRGFEVTHAFSAYDMQDVESVRWNNKLQMLCYSYEGNDATGVYMIDAAKGRKKKLLEIPLPTANRGIEGLAFMADNSLLLALETGNSLCADTTVKFYRIRYDAANKTYNGADTTAYHYPLNKCACLDGDTKTIDGTDGNGVTEILSIKDMPGKLLVLERCFNRKTRTGSTYLYLATINEASHTITKDSMLFDFTANDFPNAGRNIEGMCWADDATLLLVADDNFSDKQVSVVVELKMVH